MSYPKHLENCPHVDKVICFKKGPLFKKLQNIQEKYGTKNTFILTARPPEAAPAIKGF